MNAHIQAEYPGSTLIDVDTNPLALRLPVGAALFALRGEVWLTQEGCSDDVILDAGKRFDVGTRASIVVSATRGRAQLYVARPADARALDVTDLRDFLRSNAARLRREEIDRVLAAGVGQLKSFAARLRARLRAQPVAGPTGNAVS